jgi:hypothetical protein
LEEEDRVHLKALEFVHLTRGRVKWLVQGNEGNEVVLQR